MRILRVITHVAEEERGCQVRRRAAGSGWPLPAAVVDVMEWMRSWFAMPFKARCQFQSWNAQSSRERAKAKTEIVATALLRQRVPGMEQVGASPTALMV